MYKLPQNEKARSARLHLICLFAIVFLIANIFGFIFYSEMSINFQNIFNVVFFTTFLILSVFSAVFIIWIFINFILIDFINLIKDAFFSQKQDEKDLKEVEDIIEKFQKSQEKKD